MYQLHTEKELKYFKEVIRLHYEEGYGERRIEKILPIGHTTASRWICTRKRNFNRCRKHGKNETNPYKIQSKNLKRTRKESRN